MPLKEESSTSRNMTRSLSDSTTMREHWNASSHSDFCEVTNLIRISTSKVARQKKKKRLRVSISIHDPEKEKTHSITQKDIHRSKMFFIVSVTTTISRLNQMSAKIRDWWKSSSKISTWQYSHEIFHLREKLNHLRWRKLSTDFWTCYLSFRLNIKSLSQFFWKFNFVILSSSQH